MRHDDGCSNLDTGTNELRQSTVKIVGSSVDDTKHSIINFDIQLVRNFHCFTCEYAFTARHLFTFLTCWAFMAIVMNVRTGIDV